jgi:uncharacterized damage-inducible protein DinB
VIAQELLTTRAKVRAALLETVERFSDSELSYRPFPAGYSVAETILHIAHEEDIEIGFGLMRRLPEIPPPYDPGHYPTRQSITAVLQGSHGSTTEYLTTLTDAGLAREVDLAWGQKSRPLDMLWHVLEHEIHHRGELSLMLGLLGRAGIDV